MTDDRIDWQLFEPGQLRVVRIRGVIRAVSRLLIGGVALFVGSFWYQTLSILAAAPLVIFVIWSDLFAPPRSFRRSRWARSANELFLKYGFLHQVESVVAFHRAQHIDVMQSFIERANGVCSLVLYTSASSISLSGLSRETAEALRDEIRTHVKADI